MTAYAGSGSAVRSLVVMSAHRHAGPGAGPSSWAAASATALGEMSMPVVRYPSSW